MSYGWSRFFRLAAALLVLLIVVAEPAFAQDDEPPYVDVPVMEFTKPWLQWLFGVGFIAVCMLIAFKNPHRSHLD
ncbi:MAG: hypothetical protein PVJ57_02700 [Phycisphaerae bacterium]|jgi:hypothetical protein